MWALEWSQGQSHHYRKGSYRSVVAWANHFGSQGIEVTIYKVKTGYARDAA